MSDIQSRCALLQWGPPIRDSNDGGSKFDSIEPPREEDYRYEVLLSDKGKDGKYRSIFTGHSIECKLTDLRPHTEYHIRIHALYDQLRGKTRLNFISLGLGKIDLLDFCFRMKAFAIGYRRVRVWKVVPTVEQAHPFPKSAIGYVSSHPRLAYLVAMPLSQHFRRFQRHRVLHHKFMRT